MYVVISLFIHQYQAYNIWQNFNKNSGIKYIGYVYQTVRTEGNNANTFIK